MNIFTITFIVIIIFNIIKNKKSLHMLQQNLYNENNRYLKWLKRNSKQVFISLDLLSLLLILIAYYLNNDASVIFVSLAIFAYIGETLRLLSLYKSEKTKKPLVITKRVRRLIVDKIKELFKDYDGLILPVSTGIAPYLDGSKDELSKDDTAILEEHLQIGNFGGFPSITIPNGFIDDMPVGINITGNCYDDANVLNIAYALESTMNYKGMIAGGNNE